MKFIGPRQSSSPYTSKKRVNDVGLDLDLFSISSSQSKGI